MPEDQLRAMVSRVLTLSRRLRSDGPQTEKALHAWVKFNIGVDIPQVAVCDDHDAPFKLLATAYFEKQAVEIDGELIHVNGILVRANRGGAKTFIVAIIHYLNATYKPGCEGLQFGATEGQGKRCYDNIEDWCYEHDRSTGRRLEEVKDFILDKPMRSETKWKTGGKVEVVAGSEKAVSGPHPQKAGADEVDQMDDNVWNQSRGMAVAKAATGPLPPFMKHFNGIIPPQDLVTSTMNSMHGRMNELIEEYKDDLKAGNIPQFQLIQWCIWETIQEVPSCRRVDKAKRVERLRELGRDEDELCNCHRVVKGKTRVKNNDGEIDLVPRTLEQVCGGKAFRSRGWKPYIDLVATFKRNTPGTWMLQHECREGIDENNYIQDWSLEEYGIRNYEPRPEFGPIYMGVDWGGTNPHAVLWIQKLTTDVPGFDHDYNPIWLQKDIYVLFREIYVANIDTGKLAERVIAIEDDYREKYGLRWKVKNRFCDPQGAGDKKLFSRMGLKSSWPVKTRNKEHMITVVQNIVIDDRFAVDVDNCPGFTMEIEMWQKDDKGKEVDKFNHTMSAWRYCISNVEVLESGKKKPGSTERAHPDGKDQIAENRAKRRSDSHSRRRNVKRAGPVTLGGDDAGHPTDQFSMR
jgi:hypothetical protein